MMAIYENNRASGNVGGGFYTSSPFSRYSGNVAESNFGPGFIDDSGNGQFASIMRELLEAGALESYVEQIHGATGSIMDAVYADDKPTALSWYAKLTQLAADHVTILGPVLGALERVIAGKWPS